MKTLEYNQRAMAGFSASDCSAAGSCLDLFCCEGGAGMGYALAGYGSARPCPACGRESNEPVECLCCQQERQWRAAPAMLAALRAVVAADESDAGFHAACKQAKAAIELATAPNAPHEPCGTETVKQPETRSE